MADISQGHLLQEPMGTLFLMLHFSYAPGRSGFSAQTFLPMGKGHLNKLCAIPSDKENSCSTHKNGT